MKRLHEWKLGAAMTLLTLVACNNEAMLSDVPPVNGPDDPDACILVGDDFRWEEGEGTSRTALAIEGGVAKFSWTPGDLVGILPDAGAQVYFTIPEPEEGEEVTSKASFDGGAWALKATSDYAAYYPFVEDFHLDRTRVPVSYTGQKQTGTTTAHLGAYDFQGARPVTTNGNGGGVTFDFDHVGALVLLRFTVPEADTKLKSVTLSADGVGFITEGTYDLTSAKESGFPVTPTATSESFTVEVDHTTTTAAEDVTVYFLCAPVDLSGKMVNVSLSYGEGESAATVKLFAEGKNLKAAGGYLLDARYQTVDLTEYDEGTTIDITWSSRIVGDGTEYNLSLNIAENATVVFEEGTGGVKLNAITVADNKTLTLQVKGNVEHTVKEGISIGNGSNVIIEGDRNKENNKLTVTATDGNAAIGANDGVTAGDITIRNARVEATGSSTLGNSNTPVSGAAIGTSDANMGDISIENSIITATGSAHSSRLSFAAAIGMGSLCRSIGNFVFVDSEITAKITDETLASVIGAGSIMHGEKRLVCTMGDIIFTNTSLDLSIVQNLLSYGALIGIGETDSYHTVKMGKIIFTDMTQAELDTMIVTWTYPEDFAEWGAYIIGRSPYNIVNNNGTIGGVYVSDGNGGTVQVGNTDGYNPTGYVTNWGW